jgi:hypothetical protein
MSGTPAAERTLTGRPLQRAVRGLSFERSASPTIVLLAGLGLLAVTVYVLLGMQIATPWIMLDELVYAELAKGIAEDGRLLIRDEPTSYLSFLYPLMIAPAWLASSMETTYVLVKTINAILITLAAVPVYLWARRLMTGSYAAITTVLVLLMPSFLYSGMVMTENAFLPTFLLAAWTIALVLERPTLLRQGLAFGAIALCASVRVQGVVLVPIFLTALAVDGLLDSRSRDGEGIVAALLARARAFRYSLILLGVLAAGYWLVKYVQGEPLVTGLGAYQVLGTADYAFTETARWTLYHAAELCLSVGFVPVSAFLVVLALAAWGGASSAAERAFLAVTASATVWLVPVVAAFAGRFVMRIEERNLFYLAPLFLLALGVWLSRGAPRPLVVAIPAALGPAVLVYFLPVASFLNLRSLSDTFGLLPFLRLAAELDGGLESAESVAVFGGFAAALLFLVVPRALARILLPAAVACFLVLMSYNVSREIQDYARSIKAITYGDNGNWVDDKIGEGSEAVYLLGGGADAGEEFSRLFQTEFWNRSLGPVYRVGGSQPTGLYEIAAAVDDSTGLMLGPDGEPIRSPYVVAAAPGFELNGRLVAENSRVALFRVPGRVGLAATRTGVYGDGWMGPSASYTRFATPGGRPGRVRVVISREAWTGADVPGRVHIRVGPSSPQGIDRVTAERRWVVHSSRFRIFTLPSPRPPFRVEVQVNPTFSPSTYGQADPRQLGAQVLFAFLPQKR